MNTKEKLILNEYKNFEKIDIKKLDFTPSTFNQNFYVKTITPLPNPMVEQQKQTNALIENLKLQITELQNTLNKSEEQLKQANNKIASQTYTIKCLNADLKEARENAEKNENKISIKDKKIIILSGVIGLATGVICALLGFYLT